MEQDPARAASRAETDPRKQSTWDRAKAAIAQRLPVNGPMMLSGGLAWWLIDDQTDPFDRAQRLWGWEWVLCATLPLVLLVSIGSCWPTWWRSRVMVLPWLAGALTVLVAWIYVRLVTGSF